METQASRGIQGEEPGAHAQSLRGEETALYRHFDIRGCLLYVGISVNPFGRFAQHKRDAHWARQIASCAVEWFESKDAAANAEQVAIKNEKPAYNKAHMLCNPLMPWAPRKPVFVKSGGNWFAKVEGDQTGGRGVTPETAYKDWLMLERSGIHKALSEFEEGP